MGEQKVCSNGPGHMTKMATTPIYAGCQVSYIFLYIPTFGRQSYIFLYIPIFGRQSYIFLYSG